MTDAELISRAAGGSRAAFESLYQRHWQAVYSYAWLLSRSSVDAEDATQECFLALVRRPRSFDPARAKLRTWLIAIVRRQYFGRRRHSDRESGAAELDRIQTAAGFDDELLRVERAEAVRLAMSALPEAQREALYLFEFEGLSLAEVAEVLNIEANAVKARLYRAREQLKVLLAPLRARAAGQGAETMNEEQRDPELKFAAEEWMAPPPSAQLQLRTLAAFDREFGRAPWWRRRNSALLPSRGKRLFLATTLGTAALLLLVARAFPQISGSGSLPAGTKWTVDSEFVRYGDDGSSSVEMYATTYKQSSGEALLSRSMPGSPFMTAFGRTLDAALPAWLRFITPLSFDPGTLEKVKQARMSGLGFITGCSAGCLLLEHFGWTKASPGSGDACIDGPIVDRATILNHPTEAVRRRWTEHGRMTLWMAPDLGCFALQVNYETRLPDGSFHLVSAKRAVRVNTIP